MNVRDNRLVAASQGFVLTVEPHGLREDDTLQVPSLSHHVLHGTAMIDRKRGLGNDRSAKRVVWIACREACAEDDSHRFRAAERRAADT